ncbi:MAG: carboxypeptidase-like regulatory domain-containing protein [Tannerellaceae bacterium]|nr:carboxypeptidase-like regulatory domain-containing protein [Tannerellaceae bacterium]
MKKSIVDVQLKRCHPKHYLFSLLTLLLLPWFATHAFAQQRTVTGKVIDQWGDPLIGVNVSVKGTTTGTITDFDGNYSLAVPSEGILVFSYIGYQPQEIAIGAQFIVNVTLREDSQNLEEVVVVGYGVQKKSNRDGFGCQCNRRRIDGFSHLKLIYGYGRPYAGGDWFPEIRSTR